MRDDLPKSPYKNECAVVNLDSRDGPGTHWVCYCKRGPVVHYFDSFGNLKPPLELMRYFNSKGNITVFFNHEQVQSFEETNCGHLCLQFLLNYNNR